MQPLEHDEDSLPPDFVDELLDRKAASAYLASIGVKRSPATLAKVLSTGANGPPCVHEGRRPLYPKRQLHEWGVIQLTRLRRSPRKSNREQSQISWRREHALRRCFRSIIAAPECKTRGSRQDSGNTGPAGS